MSETGFVVTYGLGGGSYVWLGHGGKFFELNSLVDGVLGMDPILYIYFVWDIPKDGWVFTPADALYFYIDEKLEILPCVPALEILLDLERNLSYTFDVTASELMSLPAADTLEADLPIDEKALTFYCVREKNVELLTNDEISVTSSYDSLMNLSEV